MSSEARLTALPELPLVGRSDDLQSLSSLFRLAPAESPLLIVAGEGGVGKSRVVGVLADEARRRGWTVAHGCAYPVETGMPYALLSDALLPLIREMDDAALTVATRGRAPELLRLFPALADDDAHAPGQDPDEVRSRLFWTFTEFVGRLAERSPLLLVLEDLHWADPSTLSLLHFVVRQLGDEAVRILASINTDYRDENTPLVQMERSLLSLRRLQLHRLRPLTRDDTGALLHGLFGVEGPAVDSFRDLLYGWTEGNPYFIEQILESLVDSGDLHQREGTWLGWESRELRLPPTVRDAVLLRFRDLIPEARALADTLAIVGVPATTALLGEVTGVEEPEVAASVDLLVRRGLVDERREGQGITVSFRHPLARDTLYRDISLTRRERLHGRVGEALERRWGETCHEHADDLAYHFTRGGEADARATHYLAEAGRAALARHADREACDYLEAVVARLGAPGTDKEGPAAALRHDLARARSRLGDFDGAGALWCALRDEAVSADAPMEVARAERHLGLLAFWRGRPRDALQHYDAAHDAVGDADPSTAARIDLAAGVALQELGQVDRARARIDRALVAGVALDDTALRARAHRALALLETWVGRPEQARQHGWKAVELSRVTRDDHVAFWGRWVLAALEGLTGDTATMQTLMEEARTIATELHSPVLGLWVAELDVELAYGRGEWDRALAHGERAIRIADSLNQGTLLARLEVWTAMVYIGRGDLDRARILIDHAWHRSGADGSGKRQPDLHAVLPAHIGRTALYMAEDRYDEAVAVGERGLALADESGYVVWVLHRLLPLLGESYLRAGDLEAGRTSGERLRRESEPMGHGLGLAWADACDAVVAWHSGRLEEGARLLRGAAEALEAVPMIPEATRLRRQLAGRLADLGDRDGALAELRHVHDVFGRLGAEPELLKTREQFRELDARPPSRSLAEGTAELTGREVEVAALVADRLSNKAIARRLDISSRTVTTHLSNIYRKLGIGSRDELTDRVREGHLA